MMDTCFGLLMASGDIGTALDSEPAYLAPSMEIDPSTFRRALTADKQFFVNTRGGQDFQELASMNIYFNTSLYALFPGFPYTFNSAKGGSEL